MPQNFTKHKKFYMQNNQFPTKTPIESMDNSNISKLLSSSF